MTVRLKRVESLRYMMADDVFQSVIDFHVVDDNTGLQMQIASWNHLAVFISRYLVNANVRLFYCLVQHKNNVCFRVEQLRYRTFRRQIETTVSRSTSAPG